MTVVNKSAVASFWGLGIGVPRAEAEGTRKAQRVRGRFMAPKTRGLGRSTMGHAPASCPRPVDHHLVRVGAGRPLHRCRVEVAAAAGATAPIVRGLSAAEGRAGVRALRDSARVYRRARGGFVRSALAGSDAGGDRAPRGREPREGAGPFASLGPR